MAANFRILVHRNKKNFHLKLSGDFDGTSAYELINILKKNCKRLTASSGYSYNLSEIHRSFWSRCV